MLTFSEAELVAWITPLLWPFAPARQIGRRRQVAGTALLIAGSLLVSRAAAPRA